MHLVKYYSKSYTINQKKKFMEAMTMHNYKYFSLGNERLYSLKITKLKSIQYFK